MKKLLTILILVFCQTLAFGQTIVDEYEGTDSDSELARVEFFINEINKQPQNKGLIVIYSGESREKLGNILAFTKGVKFQIEHYSSKEKVSLIIAKGKKRFYKEMWSIPEGKKFPEIESIDYDFSNLKNKFLYAVDCLDCEPAVPGFSYSKVDLNFYGDVLKKNSSYQGLIEIYLNDFDKWTYKERLKDALKYAADYRQQMTKDFKIENRRITIRIKKSVEKEAPALANLYIVPPK